MTNVELTERSPEEIQSQIAETRAALDAKVQELERRLSPRARLQQLKTQASDDRAVAWAAVAAVATGACLAVTGWRKTRAHAAADDADGPIEEASWVCYTCGQPL